MSELDRAPQAATNAGPSYADACNLAQTMIAVPADDLAGPRWDALSRRIEAVLVEVDRQITHSKDNWARGELDHARERFGEAVRANPVDRDWALREAGEALSRALSSFGPVRLDPTQVGDAGIWGAWIRDAAARAPRFVRVQVEETAQARDAVRFRARLEVVEPAAVGVVGEGRDGFAACDSLVARLQAPVGARPGPAPAPAGEVQTIASVVLFGASLVPAPRCACGTRMEAASATTWACPSETCSHHEEEVDVGIYPINPVPSRRPAPAEIRDTFANLGIRPIRLGRSSLADVAPPPGGQVVEADGPTAETRAYADALSASARALGVRIVNEGKGNPPPPLPPEIETDLQATLVHAETLSTLGAEIGRCLLASALSAVRIGRRMTAGARCIEAAQAFAGILPRINRDDPDGVDRLRIEGEGPAADPDSAIVLGVGGVDGPVAGCPLPECGAAPDAETCRACVEGDEIPDPSCFGREFDPETASCSLCARAEACRATHAENLHRAITLGGATLDTAGPAVAQGYADALAADAARDACFRPECPGCPAEAACDDVRARMERGAGFVAPAAADEGVSP